MEIAADAEQEPTGAHRRQVILANTVVPLKKVLDTISLGQEFAAVEGIDVDFG